MANIGLPAQIMQLLETAVGQASEKITAQIRAANDALMNLKAGTIVFGTIEPPQGADKGNLVLQTPMGRMVLQMPVEARFVPGAELSFQVGSQPGQVKLLALDGKPISPQNLTSLQSQANERVKSPVALDIKGGALSATLLKPAPTPEGGQSLPQGTVLNVRIANIGQAGGEAVPPKPAIPVLSGEMAKPQLQNQAPTQPLPSSPAGGEKALALPVLPKEIPAQITPQSTASRPILQTPLGTVALEAEIHLPENAKLTLEVLDMKPPKPADSGKSPEAQAAKNWPNLETAVKELERENPQAARQLMNMLPAVNGKMAANLAMFTAAVRSGELKQWLGEGGVKALGETKLGKKVEAEFAENKASGVKTDAAGGQWQGISIPFFNGQKIEPINLFLRREKEEEKESGGTRFLINLQLSQLGELQIDGLVKEKERFDMIIRSHDGLPEGMRKDITVIFANSCEVCGLAGQVVFQTTRSFITPLETGRREVVA